MTDQTTAPVETRGWPHGPTAFERRHGNARMRVVTGALGIPIVLGAVWLGGWAFFLFMCLVISGAMLEFYWICEAKGARPHKALGVVFGLLLAVAFSPALPLLLSLFDPGPVTSTSTAAFVPDMFAAANLDHLVRTEAFQFLFVVGVIVLAVFATLIAEMRREVSGPIANNSATLTGIVYVGLFLSMLIGVREFFEPLWEGMIRSMQTGASTLVGLVSVPRYGAYMVIATLVTIWICDSAAYYVGRALGKHKMAPRISPKKTWEGGIGGAVFAVATMIGFKYWLLDFLSLGDAIVLGLIVGILGQVGDLAESHFKRDGGVKDSSQLIPGHGGVFDRFDSLMFVAPLVYLYLNVMALMHLVR
jgi:phosphatidate cytidylyltransferase